MALKSQYETRCEECGGRIYVGDDITYFAATASLKAESRHVVCPAKKKTATTVGPFLRSMDNESRFEVRKCEACGQVTAFKGRATSSCPYCPGPWVSGKDVAWAA